MNSTTDPFDAQADDPRLLRAAQDYLAELEAGRSPDRGAFAARYPDLADALLPYLDALDLFMAAPRLHSSSGRSVAADPPPAEPLGDFRIVREISRGGMGVVYEAVQMSLGRRVALKVLPFAAALDDKQLQRFQNEAQAAAQLHHTNIVPVYAVGHERGVHYYAMQLIDGQNLADLIRGMASGGRQPPVASEQGTDVPRSPGTVAVAELSTQRASGSAAFYRTAARLVAQAAEALEHAHQYGVIHRDIKPANLLVDARGNVWVTDFGLAQFHNRAGLTRTGDLVGTLRYMSPEQAAGEGAPLGPRTDVYSLGATLYELLTLEPVFDGGEHGRLLRQILYDEPRPLRAVDRHVPPELETIVLKAVSKNPTDRYASAQEFADDLHRFLDNKPIRARRPTLAQRARKWAQRHPSVIVAAGVLLLLVCGGSVASAALIQRAYERERKRADEVEAQYRLARASVDDLIRVAEAELAGRPGMEPVRRRMLESALDYYGKFIEQHGDDPAAQEELVETKQRIKSIYDDLAVLQGAWQLHLLERPDVLDDLELSAEKREALRSRFAHLNAQQQAGGQDFHKLSPEDRERRLVSLVRASDEASRELLTPPQLHRLWQIDVQLRGLHAFDDPDIAAKLELSAHQKEAIRALEAEMFDCGPGGPPGLSGRGGRGGHPPGRPPRLEETMRLAADKVQKLLTPEQAASWKDMTGQPFKGGPLFMGQPPGFGRGGPGDFGPPGAAPRE
jgi:serine/threonine protein kinase